MTDIRLSTPYYACGPYRRQPAAATVLVVIYVGTLLVGCLGLLAMLFGVVMDDTPSPYPHTVVPAAADDRRPGVLTSQGTPTGLVINRTAPF